MKDSKMEPRIWTLEVVGVKRTKQGYEVQLESPPPLPHSKWSISKKPTPAGIGVIVDLDHAPKPGTVFRLTLEEL